MNQTFCKVFLIGCLALYCSVAIAQEETKVTLKAGTTIPLLSPTRLRGAECSVGEYVDFKVSRPVKVDGKVVVPVGTVVKGSVTKAKRSSWWGTKGRLAINIDYMILPNGETVYFAATRVSKQGVNRTPLSVVLALFCWPCMFICGSGAEIPAGYEIFATVGNNVEI